MRFSVLDGWRGVCALLVALYHLHACGHFILTPFIRNSYLFVDFFFVLSGFVIAHAYGARLKNFYDLRAFLIRRFGRLWPLHVSMIVPLLVLEIAALAMQPVLGNIYPRPPLSGPDSILTLATNLGLVHSLGFHNMLTWNTPGWSISAEFWTYVMFAVVCIVTQRYSMRIAAVISIAAAVVVASWSPKFMDATYDFGFFRCLYGFFIGTLVYRFFRDSQLKITKIRRGAATLFEVLIVITVGIFVHFSNQGTLALYAPLLFSIAVYIFAHEGGAISYLLSASPFERLGKWSYSIYMVHAVLAIFLIRIVDVLEKVTRTPMYTHLNGIDTKVISYGGEFAMDALAVVFLGAVIVSASITYKHIEQPGQRFFNRHAV